MNIALGGLRGRLVILCTALACGMLAPAAADAAVVSFNQQNLDIREVVTTGSTEVNDITVTRSAIPGGFAYVVTDASTAVQVGAGCVPVSGSNNRQVACPDADTDAPMSSESVTVEAGGQPDFVRLDDSSLNGHLTSSTVNGGTGADQLRGLLVGSDTLSGQDDGDNLSGFGGNDTLSGGQAVDTLRGGDGDDTLRGGAGGDDFRGENGIDTVDYSTDGTSGVHARINGTPSSGANCEDPNAPACEKDIIRTDDVENLIGTSGNDFLYGSSVRNVLDARQGNDSLFGYEGDDALEGDEGDDLLQGGLANDTLDGGAGTGDTVDYTDRTATADTSDDVIVDLSKADASNGGTPDGSPGSRDTISNVENANGGAGDDVLIGKSDTVRNVLNGNDGNDFLRGNDGPDTLDGGAGTDTVSYQDDDDDAENADGVTVTPGVGSGDDGGADDEAAGSRDTVDGDVENLIGGPDNDQLFGTAAINALYGAGGSDLLTGYGAADYFFGNLATFPPHWGVPATIGTEGTNDRVSYAERAAGVTADLHDSSGNGNADDGPAGQRDYIQGATIEGLIGGAGADDLTGNAAANSLTGNGGDDFLRGGLGADTFSGGPNEDTVDYSADGHTAGVVVSVGNAGSGDGQPNEGDSVPANVENVVGTSFKDELTGEIAANKLFGLGGDDTLDGDAGNDLLDGGEGAGDKLFGGPDNDTMHGGSTQDGGPDGADTIDGGAGVNTVTYSRLDKVPGVTLAAKLLPSASSDRTAGVNVTLDNTANDGAPGELDSVLLVSNVVGAQGNDALTGSTASNTLNGMDGDDTLNPGAEGGTRVADVIIGGNGERDRVSYSLRGTDNLNVTLDGQANDGLVVDGEQVENDHIHSDVEDVTTAGGNDKVTGETDNDNMINVAGGDDEIFTRDSHADDIECGAGTDTLTADRRDTYQNCETALLPAAPTVSVSGPQNPVGENEANATFTISIDDVIGQPVTVQYSTVDGTAIAGQDYVARQDQTATIPAGSSQVQVTVPIMQDTLDENSETFNLKISSPTNATLAPGGDTASATIADDDAEPTVSVTAESVEEGDTGTKTHAVDVTLSAPSSKAVTVKYSTADGTAKAGEDYTAVSEGTVTIPAGQTVGHANVEILSDSRDEDAETFNVTLSDPTNATLGTATAAQTITDNDNPPAVSIGDASVGEGNAGDTNLVLPVTLSAASNKVVTVHYEIDPGTAEADDFTDESGDVTFQPGQTASSITVKVKGDTAPEADETVTVTLSNPGNATLGDATGTGTIVDDDTPGLSVDDVTVSEGDDGTKNATFTVTLAPASDEEITVMYATAPGTATQPADFTQTSGTLTFAAGEVTKQVSVPVKGDTVDEADETFTLQLSGATNAEIADGTGVGTITDDDPSPALSVTGGEVIEGNEATTQLKFTVSQSAVSERDVTVKYATVDGTAKAGEDYTATSGTLTITAGQTTGEVNVPVSGDTAVEEDEAFTLVLSEPSNATLAEGKDKATGTIKADDKAPDVQPAVPGLSVNDIKVAEGDKGTVPAVFTVTLSEATTATVTAKYATSDFTATAGQDYQAAAGTITFAPGERTKTISVNVIGDRRDEADEAFALTLSEPGGATLQKAAGAAMITDDETPRVAPRRVTARTTPSRDRAVPYRFRTTGRVTLPSGVRRSDACAGKVQVRFKAGSKTISTRRANLRRDCTFRRSVSFGIRSRVRPGRLKVQVRFLGNAVLLPKSARTRFVRAG